MNTTMLSLLSPAKLNLFLHITGRRSDGYHNLQTLFQLLDYGDDMGFCPRKDSTLTLTPAITGVAYDDNLIIKAAKLLQTTTQCRQGADISLVKRLPMGGGLGGGSSNSATTLVALNHLWGTQLSAAELAALGQQLGADIPVFVHGQTAWGEGIGEQLQPITRANQWYLIIKPDCDVSTAKIFSSEQLTRDTPAITVAAFLEQGGHNDCQSTVCRHYPEVAATLKWLDQYAAAQLTGTGACVFASFTSKDEANAVLRQLSITAPKTWHGFIAQGINASPSAYLLS